MATEQPPRPGAAALSRAPVIGALGATALAALALSLATTGIKPDEGKANRTYLDVASIPTYCYDHADRAAKVGGMHTDAQCDALLSKDVQAEQTGVVGCVPGLRQRPYQWAASTRLAHDIGVTAFLPVGRSDTLQSQ